MSERDPPPDPPRRQTSRGGGLNVVRVQEAAAATGEHRAPLPARQPTAPMPLAPMPMAMDDLLSSSPPPTSRPITDPGRVAPRRPLAATMDLDPVVEGSLPVRRPSLETSSPSVPRPRPPSPSSALTSSPSMPAVRQPSSPGTPAPPARSVSAADLAFPSLAADAAPAPSPSGPSLASTIAASVSSSLSGLRVLPFAAAGVAVIALIAGVVFARTLADASAGFSPAEARQLVDVWLKQGAWGRPRLDEVVAAVAAVGKTVTPAQTPALRDAPPRFIVLREAERAQGIALADGTVVVTTGTLRRLQSEAELAAVLAHALAHLALGDATRALDEHPGRSEARAVLQTNRPHPAATVVDQLLSSPASSGSSDAEARAITLTLQTLKAAGWSEAAFSDVLTRLAGTTWAAQHPVPSSVGPALQQAPRGREQRPEYSRTILDRVTPMTAAPTTAATSTAGRP